LVVVGIIIAGALAGWSLWPRKSEVPLPNSTGQAGDGLGINAVDAPQERPTPSTPPPDSIIGTSLKAASDRAAQGPAAASAARMVETLPSGEASTPSIAETPATNDPSRGAPVTGTELVIATEPAGARVTVNGIGWGTAPITIRHLPPGVQRIRVSKDGYVSEDRLVNLRENQSSALDLRLRNTP